MQKTAISEALHIPCWVSFGKYLGIPAEWGIAKGQTLQWNKERVFTKLEWWKERFLSQAWKEVLIKSVIQAITSYVMSIVRLPKNFCQSLCSAEANFWWSSMVRSRCIHWKK